MKYSPSTIGAAGAVTPKGIFEEDFHDTTQGSSLDLDDLRDLVPPAHALAAMRDTEATARLPEFGLFDRYPGT